MKSIKPGRGPSAMETVGAVIAVVFGIFWTITAISMGAPVIFPVFGVIFILMGAVQGLYHLKNAVGKDRFSEFDITDSSEEGAPFDRVQKQKDLKEPMIRRERNFCPFCGAEVHPDFCFLREVWEEAAGKPGRTEWDRWESE